MELKPVVALFLVFTVSANAAEPQGQTGRAYVETALLLSHSDFDVRLGAKVVERAGTAGRQAALDLIAEVAWNVCSGKQTMSTDAISWLAKVLGNTKQARYAGLLDYCLSTQTDKKVIKYLTLARGSLEGVAEHPFEGGKTDLEQQRANLAKSSSLAAQKQVARQFEALHRDQTLDEVFTAVGRPGRISGVSVPRGAVGHAYVKVKTSEDMIEFTYVGLGTVRFAYSESQANWLLDVAQGVSPLYWSKLEGRFATLYELVNSDDERELREVARYMLKQNGIEKALLNRVADRIYRSRLDTNEEMADSLAWLSKVLARSRDGRYRKLLFDVSNTAASKKLRKYALQAATELPASTEADYVPVSADKSAA